MNWEDIQVAVWSIVVWELIRRAWATAVVRKVMADGL